MSAITPATRQISRLSMIFLFMSLGMLLAPAAASAEEGRPGYENGYWFYGGGNGLYHAAPVPQWNHVQNWQWHNDGWQRNDRNNRNWQRNWRRHNHDNWQGNNWRRNDWYRNNWQYQQRREWQQHWNNRWHWYGNGPVNPPGYPPAGGGWNQGYPQQAPGQIYRYEVWRP